MLSKPVQKTKKALANLPFRAKLRPIFIRLKKIYLIYLFLIITGACTITTIIDYNNIDYERFVKNYNFEDTSFDSYRYNDFLLFTRFSHNGYEYFNVYLSIYTCTNEPFDYTIDKVELLDNSYNILFLSEDIINNSMPKIINDNLYMSSIELIKDIPKKDLENNEYFLNLYVNNKIYKYSFYPKKRSYFVMP